MRTNRLTIQGDNYREWIATDAKGRDVVIYATAYTRVEVSVVWIIEIKNFTRDGSNCTVWRGVVESKDLKANDVVAAWLNDVAIMTAAFGVSK